MKKVVLFVLVSATLIFSQEIEKKSIFEIHGGMSMPIDENSESVNLGFIYGIAWLGKINPNISIGGSASYNRWTEEMDLILIDVKATQKYYEAIGLLRISGTRVNGNYAFAQFGAGFYSGVTEVEIDGETDSSTENDFGINISGGFVLKNFLVTPSYKYVFANKKDVKWLSLIIGVSI